MRYFKISEKDLIRLLRDSLTLREIQSVKPVSEDLAELELSKFHEVPEYIVPMSEKPFCYVEAEQSEQEEQCSLLRRNDMLTLKQVYDFFDSIDFDFFLEENGIGLVNSVEIADITGRTVFKTKEPFAAVEVIEGFPVISEILTAVRKEIADCYLRHGYVIDRYKIVIDGDDEDMIITGLSK